MKKLKVSLVFTRNSSKIWNLQITDEASKLMIGEVQIGEEQFSDFMSHTYTTGTMNYYGSPNVGKTMEVKTVHVPLAGLVDIFKGYDERSRERDMKHIRDLAEELNPGFKADVETYNGYRHQHLLGTYKVTLRRYLEEK